MNEFRDKVIVITGASSGIGKCIADEFKACGAKVAIIDIKPCLEKYDLNIEGDITKQDILEEFAKNVVEKFEKIDYLINNACEGNGGVLTSGYEEFLFTQKLGVIAPFYLSKLFMDDFNQNGVIINISSTRAFQSQSDTECYSAAKGGIIALTHSLAVSLRGKVRVNAISPGWINTTNDEVSFEDKAQHLVNRVGESKDISNAIMFLCSQKSSFITGQNFIIDGGMSKQMIYHNDKGWEYKWE